MPVCLGNHAWHVELRVDPRDGESESLCLTLSCLMTCKTCRWQTERFLRNPGHQIHKTKNILELTLPTQLCVSRDVNILDLNVIT